MALKLKTAPTIEPITLAEAKLHLRIDSTDFNDDVTLKQSIAPGSHAIADAYSLIGTTVDVLGYSTIVALEAGTNSAGGKVDVKVQESDNNIAFTDVVGGAFGQITEGNDNTTYKLAYIGTKRYIRAVSTVAQAACEFAVTVIKDAATSAEDSLLNMLIITAREYCEGFQKRAYLTQTWELVLDAFPERDYLAVPLPPLASVVSVKNYDAANVEATFASSNYFVDTYSEPGRVGLVSGASWPSTQLRPFNGVIIEYVAGAAARSSVSTKVKQAMLLLVAHWYEHREAVLVSAISKELEFAVQALLSQDCIIDF